jgi:hypothetical protein
MDSTPPSKDTIWQTGLKRKLRQSVVYKRLILLTEINTGLGWKAGRRFTKPKLRPKTGRTSNTYIRQSRLQTYIGQMRQRMSLHTNKRGNTSKGNNNYQPICTQSQCTQFHQTYTKRLKSTYRLQHIGSGRLRYPSITNRQVIPTKKILELSDTINKWT